MTAKDQRYARYATGIALLSLLPAAAMAGGGPYLNWRAKAAPVQQSEDPAPVQAAQVPVPPSPYGQVGDPYLHVLNWRGKSGNAAPPIAAQPATRPSVATAAPV